MEKRILLILTAVLASCAVVSAQRTSQGSSAITLMGDYSFSSGGLSADYCYYTLFGMVKAGVSAVDHRGQLTSGERFSWPHIVATGDYLFRLAGTRNRALSIYTGGGLYLGGEFVDFFKELPETTTTDVAGNRFIIGVDVQAELEWFVSRTSALVLMFRCPIDFVSPIHTVNPEVRLGFRFNFE